jgi:ethanolamine utilization protein EutP (predicted NTPase)
LIRSVFSNVLVLITKYDITRPNQREAITAELRASRVRPESILVVSENDPASLRAVVARSLEMLPDAYRDAFLAAQIIDPERQAS